MAEAVTSPSIWNPGTLYGICGGQSDKWDRFSSEYFGFALSVSFHQCKKDSIQQTLAVGRGYIP